MTEVKPESCPYKDFYGADLHEGDWIIHPDGDVGKIIYRRGETDADSWLVEYEYHGGGPLARLCIQVGEMGQACGLGNCQQNQREPHDSND